MKNFYKITAKCGHVGKNHYYKGAFYETAEDAREAAEIVRFRPRVKHEHKDAILFVENITYEEYIEGMKQKEEERYFLCKNRQEQQMFWTEIEKKVFPEPKYLKEEKERERKRKKPYKRTRFDWKKELLEVA